MHRPWISTIALVLAAIALAGVLALAFAYENLRRQMAGISSDMARLPSISASHEHFEARLAVIRSQLSRVKRPIVVLGDSIVESALLPPSLCGHPVINAGVGGATIGFFARYSGIILRDAEPRLSILAVGINDAGRGADDEVFHLAYAATLQSIRSPVAISTIVAASSPLIDPSAIDKFNGAIAQLADGRTLIDLHKAVAGDFTVDGIHLSDVGYRLWTDALLSGAKRALGCDTGGSSEN
jgi:hypothetical protein